MKVKLSVTGFMAMGLVACSEPIEETIMPHRLPSFEFAGEGIVFNEHSMYAGRNGLIKFAECAGLRVQAPGLELAWSDELPPSVRDAVLTLGSFSQLTPRHLQKWRPGKVKDVLPEALEYLKIYSASHHIKNYSWRSSVEFLERYPDRRDADGTFFAPAEWYPEMYVIGLEEGGAMFLANPYVMSSDGEWEIWLQSQKIPGAYRYPSAAGLIAQLYLEQRSELDGQRFGVEDAVGTCATHLFAKRDLP